ncbi:hypothetical protein HMPREF6485_2556 [Segatella buccae ATCC 33574]|uniref:Uncharacterized protein n=1 Tax=Segatella buccae ATCC 33574 TaxID=873513 RepID=E6KAC0_9BACT|nr:hypothetical protein HMPREF6485_2556 [Segatella buccae ATCC 33574]
MDKNGKAGARPIGNCEPQLDDTHGPAVDTKTATMGGGKALQGLRLSLAVDTKTATMERGTAFAQSAFIAGSRHKNSHDGRGHGI